MQAQTGQEPIAAIEAMDQTQRQTGDAVIAGTIISSHSLTHLYVNGFQLIIPKIAQDLALVPFQVGLIGSVMSVPVEQPASLQASPPTCSSIGGDSCWCWLSLFWDRAICWLA